ncbi:Polyribonucleotide nucleotidyltransferase [hydrothermal vent metagenome]|uniref:polyribonucleotide nucleotidyltransferase n=1 Tax=hydrothermal vent metagenome TaxID=652676 RepID=A0A3B1DHW9_9ZZZZ
MNLGRVEIPFGAQSVIIETGKLAKQANASVTVTCGGTTVLVAVCMSDKPKEGIDFFPLMVEYQEKIYAAGRIPGGFLKREARPSQKETLTARVIDRPIRPLFPKGFYNEVVVTCMVISYDGENDPDILATIGASAALTISDIPFDGPIGASRIGMVDGNLVLNPTSTQKEESAMDLIVVGHENGIVMIEGEANELPEAKIVEALEFANEEMKVIREKQVELRDQIGKPKTEVILFNPHPDLQKKVDELTEGKLADCYKISDKSERETALKSLLDKILSDMSAFDNYKVDDKEVSKGDVRTMFDNLEYEVVRNRLFEEGKRADGRGPEDIRALISEIDILPRTHGSSLFTRGQTQSLATVTLGTKRDEKMVESLDGVSFDKFMLHYNFPAFSVGEARGSRGPGRREIGHGALAAKALRPILPTKDEFPYTIRIVSEILESNGSSSMASVCAGCLSLMAAGVPIKNPVAGISIGLIMKDDDYRLLTDIMGLEDHFGDMDYKIAGSSQGITAIQLDMKIKGVPMDVLAKGIDQAREARVKILENMIATIPKSKGDVSEHAPRITVIQIPESRIGEIIGPGGKMIKRIIEETGCETIDIDDDGKVTVAALSKDASDKASVFISGLVTEPDVGRIYDAKVVKIMNFGVFCEFLPGKQGLVHVSELADGFVKDPETVVKVGDMIKVKLTEIDKMKRMNLSKKQADAELAEPAQSVKE